TLREGGDDYFLLDYPNTEVLDSMSELVTRNMVQTGGGEFMDFRTSLIDALTEDDCELFIETINRLLASIPYDDYISAMKQGRRLKISAQEWLYRSTILAFLRGCGVLTFGEMHGNQGRSDLIVTCRGNTWIIEIKVAKDNDCEAQAQEAMKQIDDRQYAEPHKNGKKVGIAIDDNTRQIGEWVEA
ncbi:MAG: PD-(D/E)XK nuclease domain-containing protein, partial [Chitinispirillales bacterium]|nr:PD-(D/E)XK nuclease domain-containing protein [Chitinispirillales bacterium]